MLQMGIAIHKGELCRLQITYQSPNSSQETGIRKPKPQKA